MKISRFLRKIPIIKEKIKVLKPQVEDVFLQFYNSYSKITFLDIGANQGQTIDSVTKVFKNIVIYSFEPTPDLFVSLNQKYGNRKNLHIENLALSDKNTNLDFYLSAYSPTNSCLEPNVQLYKAFNHPVGDILQKSSKIKVKGMKLDNWYSSNPDLGLIDIIKIDTQGYEFNVIQGGLETLKYKVKFLYFEILYLNFYKESVPFYKIFELLYDNGFYLYCFLSSERQNKYQTIVSDVLFVNKKFIKPGKINYNCCS